MSKTSGKGTFEINRNLLNKNGDRVSFLQIIGFVIMMGGLLYLAISLMRDKADPEAVAISFFIIMLGFAFAFPTLLRGTEGLSTMRIVVFMMTNVICMLLLKIGWTEGMTLDKIGLDEYWMGVIAFIFGGKATQSYFERMAAPKHAPAQGMAGMTYTGAEKAKLAVAQNEQYLKAKFPNIEAVSDTVRDLSKPDSHVVALYLKDNNTAGIPDKLEVKLPDGKTETIPTEIVKNVGSGGIQINQWDEISNAGIPGSVCCIVKTGDGAYKVATAGHVVSKGNAQSYGGVIRPAHRTPASVNGAAIGNWYFQLINDRTDVALADIDNWVADPQLKTFTEHYEVSDNDIGRKVTVVSNASNPHVRTAYIVDYNTKWPVEYDDKEVMKHKIIMIGSRPDRDTSLTVSTRGDSGGCVYDTASGKLIGLILGGNDKFTWVLSLKDVFDTYNFQLT